MAKTKPKHLSYISVPSPTIPIHGFLIAPSAKKPSTRSGHRLFRSPKLYLPLLLLFIFLGFLLPIRLSPIPCSTSGPKADSFAAVALPAGESIAQEQVKEGFWRQPEGYGYRPCLDFSAEYRKGSKVVIRDRRKYLMVVVSGGMNQQRNQIVDAVVIARILGAALVVPILQVNVIWGDERYIYLIFTLVSSFLIWLVLILLEFLKVLITSLAKVGLV